MIAAHIRHAPTAERDSELDPELADSPLRAALNILLDPATSAEALASEMLTTPGQLAEWSNLPKLQAVMETIEKIYHTRARLIAAEALPAAVNMLTHLVRESDLSTPQSREVARRAAMGIIRFSRARTAGSQPTTISPPQPTPPPTPPSSSAVLWGFQSHSSLCSI